MRISRIFTLIYYLRRYIQNETANIEQNEGEDHRELNANLKYSSVPNLFHN
jgi:hypothetical protein